MLIDRIISSYRIHNYSMLLEGYISGKMYMLLEVFRKKNCVHDLTMNLYLIRGRRRSSRLGFRMTYDDDNLISLFQQAEKYYYIVNNNV